MANWNISGSWAGEYRYDLRPDHAPVAPTPFTLELKKGWLGAFHGTVQDSPARGPIEPGAVSGKVAGDLVTFLKQMPEFLLLVEERRVTLREYMLATYGLRLDKDLRPPPIEYEGRYDAFEKAIKGTWLIPAQDILLPVQGQFHVWPSLRITGTWSMRRLHV